MILTKFLLLVFLVSDKLMAADLVTTVYKEAKLLVKTPEADPIAFQIYALENHNHIVFGDKLAIDSEEIQKLFERAKFFYLEGSLEKSKEQFEKINALKYIQHWSVGTKKLIHYSLLRLADLAKSKNEKNSYLLQALAFAPEIPPDQTIFAPPLIESYQQLKNRFNKKFFILPSLSEKFDWIWINGEKQKITSSFIANTDGVKLITLVSPSYWPQTFKLNLNDFKNVTLKIIPTANPNCSSEPLSNELKDLGAEIKIYGRLNCNESNLGQNSNLKFESQPKSFWSNKYVWMGLGILATSAAVHLYQKNNSGPTEQVPQIPEGPASIQSNHPR